jgi:nicotinic acid mononucleotide adenylyltransferase
LASTFRYDPGASGWAHVSGNMIFFKEINLLDISSTKVRELVEKRGSIKYLVPHEVEAYIKKHGLYRSRQVKGKEL